MTNVHTIPLPPPTNTLSHSPHCRTAARAAFINVCRLERDFWAMAYET